MDSGMKLERFPVGDWNVERSRGYRRGKWAGPDIMEAIG